VDEEAIQHAQSMAQQGVDNPHADIWYATVTTQHTLSPTHPPCFLVKPPPAPPQHTYSPPTTLHAVKLKNRSTIKEDANPSASTMAWTFAALCKGGKKTT
jgi:hypothetical protein